MYQQQNRYNTETDRFSDFKLGMASELKRMRTCCVASAGVNLQCIHSCHDFTALHWMQGGLVARKVSVRPFVCPSYAWIVTKLKKNLSRFLYHTKNHSA